MIESFIHYIQISLLPLGSAGVFIAAIIEEVIAPIPSVFVLTSAGFFLIENHAWTFATFQKILFIIAIPGAAGITLGSLLVYGIGYGAGKPLLERWGSYFGISWNEVEKMERRFEKGYSDEMTLFLVRAIPIIPSVVISTFCGLIRLPIKEYLLFSFLGTIVRAFILGVIGWQVGGVYSRFAAAVSSIENAIFVAVGIAGASFIAYRYARKRG